MRTFRKVRHASAAMALFVTLGLPLLSGQTAEASTGGLRIGAAPATHVQAGSTAFTSGSTIDFGNVALGVTGGPQVVPVTNLSSSSVVLSVPGGESFGMFNQSSNCNGTLAPGKSCDLVYGFAPTATGSQSQTVTGTIDSQSYTFFLQGVGVSSGTAHSPFLITPTALAFGDQAVGTTSASQSVTITNETTTTQPVALSGGAGGVFGGATGCPKKLGAGLSCQLSYQFTPTATGPVSGSTGGLVAGQLYQLSFTGTGIVPPTPVQQFLISPTGFDFGAITVGSRAPSQSATITNTGTTTATLNLAGGGAGPFGGTNNCPATLAPGRTCVLTYAFAPTATGITTATTTVDVGSQSFVLHFLGVGDNQLRLSSGSTIDFGNVALGVTGGPQVVPVTNLSSSSVVLSVPGGESFGMFNQSSNCNGTLAPGKSCDLVYGFAPTATGSQSQTVTGTIDSQSYTFFLQGVGVSSGTAHSPFLITPTALAFGDQAVGTTSASQSVTITNETTTTQPVALSGGAGGVFGGATGCPKKLGAGLSCQLSYQFTPTATGPVSGSTGGLVAGQLYQLSFTGTGIVPPTPVQQFLISPTGFDFGAITVGSRAPSQSATITNTGTTTATLNLAGGGAGPFGGTNNCPATLAPGRTCVLTYAFAPTATGITTATTTVDVGSQSFVLHFLGVGDNQLGIG